MAPPVSSCSVGRSWSRKVLKPKKDRSYDKSNPTILRVLPSRCQILLFDPTQAESLIDKGIHPIRIADGFELAAQCAVKHLDEVADKFEIDHKNPENLVQVAMTTLGSKM